MTRNIWVIEPHDVLRPNPRNRKGPETVEARSEETASDYRTEDWWKDREWRREEEEDEEDYHDYWRIEHETSRDEGDRVKWISFENYLKVWRNIETKNRIVYLVFGDDTSSDPSSSRTTRISRRQRGQIIHIAEDVLEVAREIGALPIEPVREIRWRTCAYYISKHKEKPNDRTRWWGIHIYKDCLLDLSRDLRDLIMTEFGRVYGIGDWWATPPPKSVDKGQLVALLNLHATKTAFSMVIEHEYFHYRFNVLLDHFEDLLYSSVVNGPPLWPWYFDRVYIPSSKSKEGSDEEALASHEEYRTGFAGIRNAVEELRRIYGKTKEKWRFTTGPKINPLACPPLNDMFDRAPEGYNRFDSITSILDESMNILEGTINAMRLTRHLISLNHLYSFAPRAITERAPIQFDKPNLGIHVPITYHPP